MTRQLAHDQTRAANSWPSCIYPTSEIIKNSQPVWFRVKLSKVFFICFGHFRFKPIQAALLALNDQRSLEQIFFINILLWFDSSQTWPGIFTYIKATGCDDEARWSVKGRYTTNIFLPFSELIGLDMLRKCSACPATYLYRHKIDPLMTLSSMIML